MLKWLVALSLLISLKVSGEVNVLAFAGSAREESMNKKLVIEASNVARELGGRVTFIDFKDYPIPLYNGDLEKNEGMPAKAKELRQLMIQSDVILIASPEYNGSVSPLLKNALDWASRNEQGGSSRDAFRGKKFVIMSATPGSSGGTRGLVHLKSIIENIGGTVVAKQVAIPTAYEAFDDQGHLKNPQHKQSLKEAIQQALQQDLPPKE